MLMTRLMVYAIYSCVCCVAVVFFIFKQKTAHEMRISDWSSDVCSSDLRDAEHSLGRWWPGGASVGVDDRPRWFRLQQHYQEPRQWARSLVRACERAVRAVGQFSGELCLGAL